MNIFNKVTLQSLKKNKARTLVTIIGIMLSTALICAVMTSFSSVRQYSIDFMEFSDGKWHGSITEAEYSTLEMISNSDEINGKAVFNYIGYADIGSKNDYKPYLYISGYKEDVKEMMPFRIIIGRMPRNAGEILLPEHLSENGEKTYEVGDTLELEIGDRRIDTDAYKEIFPDEQIDPNADSYMLNQHNPLTAKDDDTGKALSAENLDIREKRKYTVVGIYKRPDYNIEDFSAPGYTAITVPEEYDESMVYDIYYRMNNPRHIYSFMKENNISGSTNTDLLLFMGVSRYKSFYSLVFGIVAIVIGLIMFGSVMLIYNAFAISVAERTKQFGLLSSIGGTKKQLRKMVRFEATALSIIGIPLGIILGIAGMWVTFLAIGSKFHVFIGSDYNKSLHIKITPAALIASAVIAFITISISALIPSKRATKVTAVEAIRMNADIKQPKHVKTPKLIYKVFGLPGVLAHKYFKRSKKKYRATIISLFMSIVLFVSASAFTQYLTGATGTALNTYGYDYEYYWDRDDPSGKSVDDVLELIKSTDHITDASYSRRKYLDVLIPENSIDPKLLSDHPSLFEDEGGYFPIPDGYKKYTFMTVLFVDDAAYLDYVRSLGLSEEKFYNKSAPLGIVVDGGNAFDEEKGRMLRLRIFGDNKDDIKLISYTQNKLDGYTYAMDNGDFITYYNEGDSEDQFKKVKYTDAIHEISINIGAVTEQKPYFINYDDNSIIFPYSFKDDIIVDNDEYQSTSFHIKSDNIDKGYDSLVKRLKENKIQSRGVYNYAQGAEDDRNAALIVKVFAYGFIVLISLIAAANVFNTITTNINLRRREFAMLRSVGMTSKGIKKMLNFECILYGTKALLYGIPVSAGVTFLIYRAINKGVDQTFFMPWKAVGISILSVFLVVFVTMMYAMGKIKKDNTIDALKNENI